MNMVKILFASDLHSDLGKYQAIVNHANAQSIDAVLFGGDFVDGGIPKKVGKETRLIPAHGYFLDRVLESMFTEEELKSVEGVPEEEKKQIFNKMIDGKKEQISQYFRYC